MTKRERVERTMALQETDRVPLYDILFCNAAIEYFSGEKLPPLVDNDETRKTLDRLSGKAVDRMLDATRMADSFGPIVDRDYTDEFGFQIHEDAFEKTTWFAARPFDDVNGAVEFLKKYTVRLHEKIKQVKSNPAETRLKYHQRFREIQNRIGDTVHLFAQVGTGLDEIRVRLGWELFAYVEADQPGLISEVMEATTNLNITTCRAVADLSLSPAVLTYGDIACKERLLHSPIWLRREFFPRLKRLNDAWHEHGFKCLFHSDGHLMEIMDDLMTTGIDGLNPIETVAGMNLKEVRQKYPKLFLAGGIDMSQLLSNGTPEEVRQVCRQAIRDASPGYLMGSTTEINNSCKLENLIAMYEVSRDGNKK